MIKILGVGNSLITGLQGAGKSHFIMSQIKEILDNDAELNIYLANVDGVKLQSQRLHIVSSDFSWVQDAPNNSLIVYDEAGTIERFNNSSRAINSDEQVLKLTMARHQNKTIVFIGQDSSIIHPAIRKLLTRHFHFSNPYNDHDKTTCLIFPQVQDRLDGQNKAWQKNAIEVFEHKLDPEIFPLYKSVDEGAKHSKKKQRNQMSFKMLVKASIFGVITLLLFVVAAYYGYQYYQKNFKSHAQSEQQPIQQNQSDGLIQQTNNQVSQAVQPQLNHQDLEVQRGNRLYIRQQELYQERLPVDYEVIANNDDLRIAGAVSMGGRCVAYNQRGERLDVSQRECRYNLAQAGNMMKPRQTSTVVTSHEPQQQNVQQEQDMTQTQPITSTQQQPVT